MSVSQQRIARATNIYLFRSDYKPIFLIGTILAFIGLDWTCVRELPEYRCFIANISAFCGGKQQAAVCAVGLPWTEVQDQSGIPAVS